jgi:hypothetical protein
MGKGRRIGPPPVDITTAGLHAAISEGRGVQKDIRAEVANIQPTVHAYVEQLIHSEVTEGIASMHGALEALIAKYAVEVRDAFDRLTHQITGLTAHNLVVITKEMDDDTELMLRAVNKTVLDRLPKERRPA